jgi:hypothetical protein
VRAFTLERDEDVTGISGTGTVAEGVEFADGQVVMRWLTSVTSTVIYASIDAVEIIHGHGGTTRIVWVVPS